MEWRQASNLPLLYSKFIALLVTIGLKSQGLARKVGLTTCFMHSKPSFSTPEMLEFLEQLSTLGIRLLDAASSGKAKQLLQDTRNLAWRGIEMANDPSTTLALAEVTAHLCHALEDTQKALNPTPRKHRNTQNRSVYLNPYQMADFPEQVTMEEVILSCLGLADDNKKEFPADDNASLPSRLTLDDDLSLPERDDQDWKERKERVNVQLLREKIMTEGTEKLRVQTPTDPLAVPLVDEYSVRKERVDKETEVKELAGRTTDESITAKSRVATNDQAEDMEDIAWSAVPGGRRLGIQHGEKQSMAFNKPPALQQFYKRLDELLEQDRQRLQSLRASQESTINNPRGQDDGESNPWNVLKARIKKLKGRQESKVLNRATFNKSTAFGHIPKNYRGLIIAVLGAATLLSSMFFCLAMYGIYALLLRDNSILSMGSVQYNAPSSQNHDIVIRIVREIVYVRENGEIIGATRSPHLSQEELEKVGQGVASIFR